MMDELDEDTLPVGEAKEAGCLDKGAVAVEWDAPVGDAKELDWEGEEDAGFSEEDADWAAAFDVAPVGDAKEAGCVGKGAAAVERDAPSGVAKEAAWEGEENAEGAAAVEVAGHAKKADYVGEEAAGYSEIGDVAIDDQIRFHGEGTPAELRKAGVAADKGDHAELEPTAS